MQMKSQIKPHGGNLANLLVDGDRAALLGDESSRFLSVTLTQRQLCDLELLMNGGFSPLKGFMSQEIYESVLNEMRLPGGLLWPMPVTLDIPTKLASQVESGSRLALRDSEGFMLAVLSVEDVWRPDKKREADVVYGTTSEAHPGVRYLYEQVHDTYVGGSIEGIQFPMHYDFEELRHTPKELCRHFEKLGWRRVVAFQTAHPMHRRQRDITLRAAKEVQAHILIHPAVGESKVGDLQYYVRVRCYQKILKYYPHNLAMLSLLPLASRVAGPREVLWRALIHQNFGCTHLIVDAGHAGEDVAGKKDGFYRPYSAQELIGHHQNELKISMVPIKEKSNRSQHIAVDGNGTDVEDGLQMSEGKLSYRLAHGLAIPDGFSYPEVIEELQKASPPRSQRGITLFFTGLSGAGKSTLAKILYGKFLEAGGRPVTLLDGDVVRQNLSSELGFSKEHRDLNIQRIGFVASEITKNRGVAICAPIAPYTITRRAVRETIEQYGDFIEIHVATPLGVCEGRDRKGLYAKARKGIIQQFTGISDPYENPENPEIRIDTSDLTPMQAAQEIFLYLLREGYLDGDDGLLRERPFL